MINSKELTDSTKWSAVLTVDGADYERAEALVAHVSYMRRASTNLVQTEAAGLSISVSHNGRFYSLHPKYTDHNGRPDPFAVIYLSRKGA